MYLGKDTYNGITKELLVVNLLLISIMSKTSFSESVETINTDNLVIINDNETTTTSLKIAEFFGKRHDNILTKIKLLDCSSEFRDLNFKESQIDQEMPTGGIKKQPMYYITKDGFVFLTMGFTGSKASKFKEAYINKFNQMEKTLKESQNQPTQVVNFQDIREVAKALLLELDGKDLIIKSKDETIAQLAPKADFVDRTMAIGNSGLTAMNIVAKEIDTPVNALYKLLRESKVWFYCLNQFGVSTNNVISKYIDKGYFVIKQIWSKNQNCYFDKIFATPKGKLLCYRLAKKDINQLMELELA